MIGGNFQLSAEWAVYFEQKWHVFLPYLVLLAGFARDICDKNVKTLNGVLVKWQLLNDTVILWKCFNYVGL